MVCFRLLLLLFFFFAHNSSCMLHPLSIVRSSKPISDQANGAFATLNFWSVCYFKNVAFEAFATLKILALNNSIGFDSELKRTKNLVFTFSLYVQQRNSMERQTVGWLR